MIFASLQTSVLLETAHGRTAARLAIHRSPASFTQPRLSLPDPRARVYDEQGIRATRRSLESKGLEIFRSPAGNYTFNVGVHSLFVYSVTQCLPLEKDVEVRFAVKQVMAQYQPDGQEPISLAYGRPSTNGTVSVFFAF